MSVAIVSASRVGNGAGYLLNDNTASGEGKQEADVACCMHCQKVILLQKWRLDGGYCGRCQAPICGPCADAMMTDGCVPFKKKVDEAIEANYRRQQLTNRR